jgi:hypothetical protein
MRRIAVQSQPRQTVRGTPSQKYPSQKKKKKRAGGVAQGVQALSSNPNNTKKQNNKKRKAKGQIADSFL